MAGRHVRVHHHELVAVIDTHQLGVPLHAHEIAEQPRGHGIVAAVDLDVSVGMHGALAAAEERKGVRGERAQGRPLDLDEVSPDLAARSAVDA